MGDDGEGPVTLFAGNGIVPHQLAKQEHTKHYPYWPSFEKGYVLLAREVQKQQEVKQVTSVLDIGTFLYLFHRDGEVIERVRETVAGLVRNWNEEQAKKPWNRSTPKGLLTLGEIDLPGIPRKSGLPHYSKIELEAVIKEIKEIIQRFISLSLSLRAPSCLRTRWQVRSARSCLKTSGSPSRCTTPNGDQTRRSETISGTDLISSGSGFPSRPS